VVLGTHNQSGVKRAIKIIDKSKLTDQLAERVKRECDINFMVNHPHIAQVYEIYESEEDISIVMELSVLHLCFARIALSDRLSA
jgi:serine/threonine protein kinase